MAHYTEIVYHYRDGANYKSKTVAVAFPGQLTDALRERILASMEGREHFIAHQVGLPEVFLYRDSEPTDMDHCYHELITVQPVTSHEEEPPENLDVQRRTLHEFVTELEQLDQWKAFDPNDSF